MTHSLPFSGASLLLLLSLTACASGPDYQGAPQVLAPAAAFVRGGDTLSATPQAARWWQALGDQTLNDLIAEGFRASPTLEATAARLRRARGLVAQDRAARLPGASLSGTYMRGSLPGGMFGGSEGGEGSGGESGGDLALESYNLGLMASWEPDLFGRLERTTQQDTARAEAADAEMQDAYVTLAADIATAYVNLRDQQARLTTAQEVSTLQHQRLELIRQRHQAGAATAQAVLEAEAAIEQADMNTTRLEGDVALSLNQLAVLTGREPGALDERLATPAAIPLPPQEVAVGDPASLIRRRPDVRQAERGLAAATASVGVARSQRFPQVSFLGLLGMGGPDLSDMLDSSNLTKLLLPSLQWNVLDWGKASAQIAQTEAGRDEAEAGYRATVLGALQDAEGALARFGQARKTYYNLARTATSTQQTAQLSGQRLSAGTISRIDDIEVQHRALEAQQNLSQGQAGVTRAFIAVEKSLGLGWEAAD